MSKFDKETIIRNIKAVYTAELPAIITAINAEKAAIDGAQAADYALNPDIPVILYNPGFIQLGYVQEFISYDFAPIETVESKSSDFTVSRVLVEMETHLMDQSCNIDDLAMIKLIRYQNAMRSVATQFAAKLTGNRCKLEIDEITPVDYSLDRDRLNARGCALTLAFHVGG